jgi:hypothetical protein
MRIYRKFLPCVLLGRIYGKFLPNKLLCLAINNFTFYCEQMLIGDTSDFAIEVMVEPDLEIPSSVWGRMCVHIGNVTLGDFDDSYCALYPAYLSFKWHTQQTNRLWHERLENLSPEEIHDMVHFSIYDVDDETGPLTEFDFLTNWGEQFDGYSSVIVSPTRENMMILHRPYLEPDDSRRLSDDFVIAYCTHFGFIDAAKGFVSWFDSEAKRLSGKTA